VTVLLETILKARNPMTHPVQGKVKKILKKKIYFDNLYKLKPNNFLNLWGQENQRAQTG
jgi:hypothetical protein